MQTLLHKSASYYKPRVGWQPFEFGGPSCMKPTWQSPDGKLRWGRRKEIQRVDHNVQNWNGIEIMFMFSTYATRLQFQSIGFKRKKKVTNLLRQKQKLAAFGGICSCFSSTYYIFAPTPTRPRVYAVLGLHAWSMFQASHNPPPHTFFVCFKFEV